MFSLDVYFGLPIDMNPYIAHAKWLLFFLNKVNAIKIRSPLNRISFLNSISCREAHNHCSAHGGLQQDAWAMTSLTGHRSYAIADRGLQVTMLRSTSESLHVTENLCKPVKAAVWLRQVPRKMLKNSRLYYGIAILTKLNHHSTTFPRKCVWRLLSWTNNIFK